QYSCCASKASRRDHQRKVDFQSIYIRRCFFGGRARCFDETKEVVARISATAAHSWMLERSARGGKSRRIARSENSAGVVASQRAQLFPNALSDSRDRRIQRLLPAGNR